jgi:excisionase family DNA binding protein
VTDRAASSFAPADFVAWAADLEERVAALERELAERDSPWMTVEQTAAYIGAERQRVYNLCSDGRLRRYRDGSRVLLRRDEVDAYLADGGRR